MSEVKNGDNKENEDCLLVNIVEQSVRLEVKRIMDTIDMCKCNLCYLNACAIALNALKPFYATTTKGALLKKIETYSIENLTSITIEATRAIMIVKESPRHDYVYKENR